jgi:hypothetical protein
MWRSARPAAGLRGPRPTRSDVRDRGSPYPHCTSCWPSISVRIGRLRRQLAHNGSMLHPGSSDWAGRQQDGCDASVCPAPGGQPARRMTSANAGLGPVAGLRRRRRTGGKTLRWGDLALHWQCRLMSGSGCAGPGDPVAVHCRVRPLTTQTARFYRGQVLARPPPQVGVRFLRYCPCPTRVGR